jgi:hypothetical protein
VFQICFQDSQCHFVKECIDSTPTQRGHALCIGLSERGRDSHVPGHVTTWKMHDFTTQTFETKIRSKLTRGTRQDSGTRLYWWPPLPNFCKLQGIHTVCCLQGRELKEREPIHLLKPSAQLQVQDYEIRYTNVQLRPTPQTFHELNLMLNGSQSYELRKETEVLL